MSGNAFGPMLRCNVCTAPLGPDLQDVCYECAVDEAKPERAPRPMPTQIGAFKVIDKFGPSGMADVYHVVDAVGNEVALKMLRASSFTTTTERRRFHQELSLMRSFENCHIVRPIEDGEVDGIPYFTMELIDGGTLDDEENRERFRDPVRAAQLIVELADAVQFCHDAKPHPVLHCDIKPANVLISRDGSVKLTDFGIARILHDTSAHTQRFWGTLQYTAPEQLRGGPLSFATDVHGLGTVLYELLTGRPAYEGASSHELLAKIIAHDPEPPDPKHVGRDLSDICMTALARKPDQRYPTAAAFKDDLNRFLRGERARLRPRALHERFLRWIKDEPRLASSTLIAIMLVAFLLYNVRAQDEALQRSAETSLEFAARAEAGSLLLDLIDHARLVQQVARTIEPSLPAREAEYMAAEALEPYAGFFPKPLAFRAMTVFDRNCKIVGRYPYDETIMGKEYGFRNYCVTAKALGAAGKREATIARAHLSEDAIHGVSFPISAPLYDAHDRFNGVLLVMVRTGPAYGRLHAPIASKSAGPVAVIVGPRDINRVEAASPPTKQHRYYVVVHPELSNSGKPAGERETVVELEDEVARALHGHFGGPAEPSARFSHSARAELVEHDWRDPVNPSTGSWLAGIAPIGQTGYLVIVQMRMEDILPLGKGLGGSTMIPFIVGFGLLAMLLVVKQSSRRSFR